MIMTRLLTAEEVAERLGVTKDWVWAQARAGRIPHVQLGRYRRFPRGGSARDDAAIESAVADGTKRSSPAGLSRYVTATARRGALAARLA